MFRQVFVVVLTCILAACAQEPVYQRPAAPVPLVWPEAGAPVEQKASGQLHWREFFKDPRLQALIATALRNNRDLKIAAARVEEARAQYGIARADLIPSVGVLGSGSLLGTTGDLAGSASYSTARRYDLNMSVVSYEVDFWGRISGMSESARASYLATQSSQRTVQLSLISEVASTYFTLLQLDELVHLAMSTAKLREQTLDLVGKGLDAGGTFDYEYQQANGALASAQAALDGIEYQRVVATNKLSYLVGSTSESFPRGRPLSEQDLDASVPSGLPSEALLLRPDVIAAEQRLLSAHANIDVARAAFLPKVLLTAGIGAASQGLSSLFTGGAWSFQPVISAPLFDGGRLASSLEVAQARKVIAVAEYEKTLQLAFREVADLLFAKSSMARQVEAAFVNVKAQDKRLEIASARYQAGLVSYMEVLESMREAISAKQMTAQVQKVQMDTEAQLFKALGGEQSLSD